MILDYGFGTMTATICYIRKVELIVGVRLLKLRKMLKFVILLV